MTTTQLRERIDARPWYRKKRYWVLIALTVVAVWSVNTEPVVEAPPVVDPPAVEVEPEPVVEPEPEPVEGESCNVMTGEPGPGEGVYDDAGDCISQEPEPVEPRKRDFTIDLKMLEQECYGSAGCNVVVRPELSYDGLPLDPDESYEVIFEIDGGDDPMTERLTVTDGDQYDAPELYLGTPRADAKLTTRVTDVERLGL